MAAISVNFERDLEPAPPAIALVDVVVEEGLAICELCAYEMEPQIELIYI